MVGRGQYKKDIVPVFEKVALMCVSRYNNEVRTVEVIEAKVTKNGYMIGTRKYAKTQSAERPSLLAVYLGSQDAWGVPNEIHVLDSDLVREMLDKKKMVDIGQIIKRRVDDGITAEQGEQIAKILNIVI